MKSLTRRGTRYLRLLAPEASNSLTRRSKPQAVNTGLDKVLLQAPGVSQDSVASGDLHVRNKRRRRRATNDARQVYRRKDGKTFRLRTKNCRVVMATVERVFLPSSLAY